MRIKGKFKEVTIMKICRYDKDAQTEGCSGCEYGCLEKRPSAYTNHDFENAVKEMESDGRCRRNKASESKTTSI